MKTYTGTPFSKLLTEYRRKAGFPTAYRFYHDNGGKGVLKISYRKYLMIEQGRILPLIDRLGTFIWALRLIPKSPEANILAETWLKTMAGEDAFRDVLEPLIAAGRAPAQLSPMQDAITRCLAEKKFFLTEEQMRAISASRENHLVYTALSNDTGAWTKESAASALGLGAAAAGKAMDALTAAKLLKRSKGKYTCPIADKLRMCPAPQNNSAVPESLANMDRYLDEMVAKGSGTFRRQMILRADAQELNKLFPVLEADLMTAGSYAVRAKTPNSAMFFVENRVVKLLDF
jgi:hypothetical protein